MTTVEQDAAEVGAIVDQFRRAFTVMDMDEFKATWDADYDDLIYVPQERARALRGWGELVEYLNSVEGAFEHVTTMEVDNTSIQVLGDVAYAFFTYHFEADTPGGNEPFVVDGRDTLIAHRRDGAWKVIHYHGSAPGPY
jgi:ketosteroid isomerase-like protein